MRQHAISRTPWIRTIAVALALAVGAACGGDSTGPDPNPDPNPNPTPQPQPGAVSGTVVDDVGAPLAGIALELRAPGASAASQTTTSSGSGGYTFSSVDAGAWEVAVTVPGTHVLDGQANPVAVTVAEEQTASADFELRLLAGTVAGSVMTDLGDPVSDATVRLLASGSMTQLAEAATSAAGGFEFDRVAVGSYDVALVTPPATQIVGMGQVAADIADQATAAADFEIELLPVELAAHVQPLFSSHCTACHAGAGAPDGLELTAGDAHGHTVGVSAAQLPSMDLISPGDPDDSYLVHKIQGTHLTVGGAANRMPLGAAALRPQSIDLIRRWAAEGALDN